MKPKEKRLGKATNVLREFTTVDPLVIAAMDNPAPSVSAVGDYVLATKWDDGDPNDPWAGKSNPATKTGDK